MEYQIISTVVVLALALTMAGVLPWWLLRRQGGQGLAARTQDDIRQSIDEALRQMNAKVRWEKDHEDLVGRFDYQNGHFSVRLDKSSPYARLSYLFFYETELDNLELVRNVCNQCNMRTENARLVYSLNENGGVVDLHIVTTMLLDGPTATEVMRRELDNVFFWQRMFVLRYSELREVSQHALNHDTEKESAVWRRELFLIRETELMHQAGETDGRSSAQKPMQLGRLLETAMGLTDIVPARLMVTADGTATVVDGTDDILQYDMATPLIAERRFAHQSAVALLDFYDPRNPVRLRHLTIDFEQEEQTDDTLYYRVTLALTPLSTDRHVTLDDPERQRLGASVLVGHDLTPPAQRLEEFRYMWKEAMAKLDNGQVADLTDDERLLCELHEPTYGQRLLHGKALYEQKRFYEAVLLLEGVYRYLLPSLARGAQALTTTFYEVCFLIGSCYTHLRQYRTASYYLQLTLPAHRVTYAEMFVNCLVNGNDFRAMNFVESFLHDVRNLMGDRDDEEGDDDLHDLLRFENFLKRRKAYLLVRQEAYDEAETLLKQLLADPANSRFALNELAYIQRKRGQRPAPTTS